MRIQRELREAEDQRARTQAEVARLQGERAPKRTELNFLATDSQAQVEEAIQRGEHQAAREAQDEGREARRGLAALDAQDAADNASHNQRLAEIQPFENRARQDLSDVEQELARIDQRVQALQSDEQAARARELEARLEILAPVVEAQREAAGVSGVQDLSGDYLTQADAQKASWKLWGVIFLLAMAGSVIGSLLLFADASVPTGKVTSQTVVANRS